MPTLIPTPNQTASPFPTPTIRPILKPTKKPKATADPTKRPTHTKNQNGRNLSSAQRKTEMSYTMGKLKKILLLCGMA